MHLITILSVLARNHAAVRRGLRLWCLVVDVAETWQYATACLLVPLTGDFVSCNSPVIPAGSDIRV